MPECNFGGSRTTVQMEATRANRISWAPAQPAGSARNEPRVICPAVTAALMEEYGSRIMNLVGRWFAIKAANVEGAGLAG